MPDRQLISELQKSGLSEKEAKVYSASLQLGPSSVQNIARESGVKRSTVYSVIESLREKGLMQKSVVGIRELFEASDPSSLEVLVEERRQALIHILPKLSALHKLRGEESVIRYHEGLDAVKQVYNDLLRAVKPGEDYLVLSAEHLWHKLDPSFFDDFVQRRSKLNIRVRMILEPSESAKKRVGSARKGNERNRLLPLGTELTTNLVIIPSRVVIHQLVPPIMAMVIENQHFVKMHTAMYELIWNSLE